ncbi:MAG: hypothetical protein QMD32_06100 [Smithellaceae bacterium]|nr:hypothetical protein [Smithellaceae bacterium]
MMRRYKNLLPSLFLLLLLSSAPAAAQDWDLETLARERVHHTNPGFFNPWPATGPPGNLLRLLTWKFDANPYGEEKQARP